MPDEQQPLPNSPEARTPEGTLKDQTPPSGTSPQTETQTSTQSQEPKVEPKTDPKASEGGEKSDDKSLLNKEDEKPTGAPEKYEPFKLPEGATLDEAVITEATTVFKELGLSQEGAQKLVDFHTKQIQALAEAPFKQYQDTRKAWRDEVAADKEIGGKLAEVKTTISRALDAVGDKALTDSFRQAMDLTGAGDNPAFIKVFHKLAQAMTEGKPVSAGGPSKFGQSAAGAVGGPGAGALYPNLK